MDEQSRTEQKTSKYVEEAAKKIKALTKWEPPPGDPQNEQLKEILTMLSLRSALVGAPDQCRECKAKLDPRIRDRCPKHAGLAYTSDKARELAKEWIPVLMARGAMGLQAWLDKPADKEEGETSEAEESAKDDDFQMPSSK